MELAYAFITPYTIRKSRTGSVLSRLLGRMSSELIITKMFAPPKELAEKFAESIRKGENEHAENSRQLIRNYILNNFSPDPDGRRHRTLMLVFRGENARQELAEVTGHTHLSSTNGLTVRDSYGDLVYDNEGNVTYFEPAVLLPEFAADREWDIQCWLDYADEDPPVLSNIVKYDHPARVQQTLVLIKPDSWRHGRLRPGAIMDIFSRTGLRIICCKQVHFTISQALEFYSVVKEPLKRKLGPVAALKAKEALERELEINLSDEILDVLTEHVGAKFAERQFQKIVEFMSGFDPEATSPDLYDTPGPAKCMALVYEGEDAVEKIRKVLGPTDPHKAPPGTVRYEFGYDVMVNTAHASDSPENAQREMSILKVHERDFSRSLNELIKGNKGT